MGVCESSASETKQEMQIEEGPSEIRGSGMTPLHFACFNSDNRTVHCLLNAGVDVDTKDGDGRTALHIAAYHGNIEAVKAILAKNPNVNLKDKWGWTPLYGAKHYKLSGAVELLAKAGAWV